MTRSLMLATFLVLLAGCNKQAPIGYTPDSEYDYSRSEDPPTGGAGFNFGSDLATVRAKCAAQGGKFAQSGQVSTCLARRAEVGVSMLTLVEYCQGAACRIHNLAAFDRPDAESWLVPFEHLRRELQRQYGDPDDRHTKFPADCADDFAGCVRSGKASAKLRWHWPDGHALMLVVGSAKEVPVAIIVSYSDASAEPKR
jgi:hypothetical protein